jgi:MFS family permease
MNAHERVYVMTAIVETAAPPVVPLRRNWRFQLVWVGSTATFLGIEAADIAYPLAILALTGSPAQAAAFAIVQLVASLLCGLPAGDYADRHDSRRLLLVTEGVRVTVTGSVVLGYLLGGHVGLPQFLLVAAVLGAAQPFGATARMLLIREVVPAEQLTAALTQEQVRNGLAALAGPPIGGALTGTRALRGALPFVFTAAMFAVSLLCALFVRVPPRPKPTPSAEPAADAPAVAEVAEASGPSEASEPAEVARAEPAEAARAEAPEPPLRRMLAGVRALWQDPALRASTILAIAINTIGAPLVLVTVVVLRAQGVSPTLTGLALAGGAIGSLAGAPLVRPLHRLAPGVLLLTFSTLVIPLLAALSLPYGPWWVAAILFVANLGLPALQVLVDVLILRKVPAEQRGRTIGAVMTLFTLGMPLGTAYGGLLLQYLSPRAAVLALAATLAVAVAYCAAKPELRQAQWN